MVDITDFQEFVKDYTSPYDDIVEASIFGIERDALCILDSIEKGKSLNKTYLKEKLGDVLFKIFRINIEFQKPIILKIKPQPELTVKTCALNLLLDSTSLVEDYTYYGLTFDEFYDMMDVVGSVVVLANNLKLSINDILEFNMKKVRRNNVQ